MGNGIEGISLLGQVNESREQGKVCNMVEDIGIPHNTEVSCSRPCSTVTTKSLTSEPVEISPPLVSNNIQQSCMQPNSHEVEEVPNACTASENPVIRRTRKHGEICESPAENSTCIDKNIDISLSVVDNKVRSACDNHLDEEFPHLESHRRKIRIYESSDVSLNSVKDDDPNTFESVLNTRAKHSGEELLHRKCLDLEVPNDDSCPVIQIVVASPPKEHASGVTSKDETGDACKPCSLVEKHSQIAMEEMIPSDAKESASKNETPQANIEITVLPSRRSMSVSPNKKLLVLDVNGLLADIVFFDVPCERTPDTIISSKAVFTRPFCKDFLDFCFTHFNVGIWTSRTKRNVELILDFLLGDSKHKLLFCWDQFHCTDSGFCTIEDRNKPLIVKKLIKLWEKHDPNLSWENGQFNESNTLLLDDTPHKALCNPPYTAIFPESFRHTNINDTSLGPEGELRGYLKGLAEVENVQDYVKENPFGQRAITNKNLSWRYYQKVIAACTSSSSSEATHNRYASFNSKAFTEAVPYNRHATFDWRDNYPSSNSGDNPPRYENSQWKANQSSLGFEATHYSHGNDHRKANNSSSFSEAAPYTHGGGSHNRKSNNSYSSFSEAAPYGHGGGSDNRKSNNLNSSFSDRQRSSYHVEACNSSSTSEGSGYGRGNSYHFKAINASNPSSDAPPSDNRHGSRSYNSTASRFSSHGRQDIPERRRWSSNNALPPSSEAFPDRRRSYHWEAMR